MEGPDEVDRLLADLARWAGDRRSDEAAQSRSQEQWLRRQAEEAARFTGLALDLAEQGVSVGVATTTGRRHHGAVVAVAEDFMVVHAPGGHAVFLPYRALTVVRASASDVGTPSARVAPLGARLVHALAGLAADRPRVLLVLEGGETISGELTSVGVDVLAVRIDATPPAVVHARVDAVCEVTVLG